MRHRNRVIAIFLAAIIPAIPAAADTPGVTGDAIKIGMFGPITGSGGVGVKSLYGAAAIYRDINDKGGVNGRKIELVIEDSGCNASKGAAVAKKLIDQDRVFALHGAWCSPVALAVKAEIAKLPSVPYIVLGAASTDISTPTLPNLFQPAPTAKAVGERMVEFALSKPGASKIAIIRHSDEWAGSHFSAILAKLKERNLAPMAVETLEPGSPDATSQVLALKAASPDAVLALLYPAELAVYLRDAYKYNLRSTTIATAAGSVDDTDRRVGIPAALNDFYASYTLSDRITSAKLAPYAQIFKKYYPSESLDAESFYSMGGALAVVEALRRLGPDVTREGFIAELNKLNNFETGILAASITFTPEDHAGVKAIKIVGFANKKSLIVEKYPAADR